MKHQVFDPERSAPGQIFLYGAKAVLSLGRLSGEIDQVTGMSNNNFHTGFLSSPLKLGDRFPGERGSTPLPRAPDKQGRGVKSVFPGIFERVVKTTGRTEM